MKLNIIAALAALAAYGDGPLADDPGPAPSKLAETAIRSLSQYPPYQEGEVVEVFSAPPSIRTTRRTVASLDGIRLALCWPGVVMRCYPDGSEGPANVVFAKVITPTRDYRDGVKSDVVGPGLRERARLERRECYGAWTGNLKIWIENIRLSAAPPAVVEG